MTADPREEAERLVAAALAALSVAANGTAGFATGSAECCVCPVCKAIAAARDPDPQFAERLAGGVGDLATGLAGVLRAFGSAATRGAAAAGSTASRATQSPRTTAAGDDVQDDVWRAATVETTADESAPAPAPPPKPMAKKAVKRTTEAAE